MSIWPVGGSGRITPDNLMAQRFDLRYGLVGPLARHPDQPTWPLLGDRSEESVFDQVGPISYAGITGRRKTPTLAWSAPIYGRSTGGKAMVGDGKGNTSVLSLTSKMSCPSFSIAAGPPKEGGTCISAALAPRDRGPRFPDRTFSCSRCYALKRRYAFQSTAIPQAARGTWTLQSLRRDPTGEEWALQMVMVITDFARLTTLGGERVYTEADKARDEAEKIRRGLKKRPKGESTGPLVRLTNDLGVWDGGQVVAPIGQSPVVYNEMQYYPVLTTPLPAWTNLSSTTEHFRRLAPPTGEVVGFFRLHDSGDFSLGTDLNTWKSYIRAWTLVARALPWVHFWGPTRVWVMKNLLGELQESIRSAPNLAIRPSALHLDDLVPDYGELAAGTTVLKPRRRKMESTTYLDLPNPRNGKATYLCPVYTLSRVVNGKETDAKSCQEAGCRVCWIEPDVAVGYGFH